MFGSARLTILTILATILLTCWLIDHARAPSVVVEAAP